MLVRQIADPNRGHVSIHKEANTYRVEFFDAEGSPTRQEMVETLSLAEAKAAQWLNEIVQLNG
jgi:hypothetical protein